jgi:hypothetical protein
MSDVTTPVDLVGDIIAYENGDLSDLQTLELFAHLIRTGQAWTLQGSYGRTASAVIDAGLITREGVITDHAFDALAEGPESEED